MKPTVLMCKFALVLAVLATTAGVSEAQKGPRQEKLLNGLKLIMWPDQAADKVSVKIRVHSGSAFDPQGKEGMMYLLARNFFPNEASREFFTEDLGGKVEVVSNYDYIQINAESNPMSIVPMLDTLAQVISNPTIDKETTDKLKTDLVAELDRLEKDPAYVADQAVAKRLFGKFPYGRPERGTKDSIARIDFAELRFAKDRFFGADNATMTISGKFDPDLAYRAVRRYLGAWLKSDKRVPSTFEQPEAPKSGMPVFESPVENKSEFRIALRGIARNDTSYHAAEILGLILKERLQMKEGRSAFATHEGHILPGSFVLGVSGWNLGRIKKEGNTISLPVIDGYQSRFLSDPLKVEEFEKAKAQYLGSLGTNAAEQWLDADTYKLPSVKVDAEGAQNTKLADVQAVLERTQKEAAAFVLVFANEKTTASGLTVP
jgi:insulinase (Peptidase family M16)/peptidase M16-like protein